MLFLVFCFFFNDTATTEIYTLSLHDALPISVSSGRCASSPPIRSSCAAPRPRSEEPTSELQSRPHLVCRLLLEKKTTRQAISNVIWGISRVHCVATLKVTI